MMMASRKISPEEKMKILNLHSPYGTVMLSGFLSSLTVGLILTLLGEFILMMARDPVIRASIGHLISGIILATVIFSFLGIVAAMLRRLEYAYEEKFPLVYVFYGFCLSLFALLGVLVMTRISDNNFLIGKNFSDMDLTLWVMFIFAIFFCCFTFANPVKFSWESFQSFYLRVLSSVDYRSVYDRNYFFEQVEYAFYNATRYKVMFSLIILKIDNYAELKKSYHKKVLSKIQNDVFVALRANIRETDSAGFLGEGEVFGITIFCGGGEANSVAERIRSMIEKDTRLKNKHVDIRITFKVLPYSTDLGNPKEMIRKAMAGFVDRDAEIVKM